MNAMEAVTAAEVMDIGLTEEDIHRGMERMHWQGRMETGSSWCDPGWSPQ